MLHRAIVLALLSTLGLGLSLPAQMEERGQLVQRMATLPAGLVQTTKTDKGLLDGLFLATLKRLPTDANRETLGRHLKKAPERLRACEDIVWAVINTKEFMVVHNIATFEHLFEFSDEVERARKKKK